VLLVEVLQQLAGRETGRADPGLGVRVRARLPGNGRRGRRSLLFRLPLPLVPVVPLGMGRRRPPGPGLRALGMSAIPVRGHRARHVGEDRRREDERHVDHRPPQQGVPGGVVDVHEHLEQMDGRDAHDRRGELDLQYVGVDVREPFGLVTVALEADARDEGLVAADDHHDQQVGDHDDVDQLEHREHHVRLGGVPAHAHQD
jgi:hypothetical protein